MFNALVYCSKTQDQFKLSKANNLNEIIKNVENKQYQPLLKFQSCEINRLYRLNCLSAKIQFFQNILFTTGQDMEIYTKTKFFDLINFLIQVDSFLTIYQDENKNQTKIFQSLTMNQCMPNTKYITFNFIGNGVIPNNIKHIIGYIFIDNLYIQLTNYMFDGFNQFSIKNKSPVIPIEIIILDNKNICAETQSIQENQIINIYINNNDNLILINPKLILKIIQYKNDINFEITKNSNDKNYDENSLIYCSTKYRIKTLLQSISLNFTTYTKFINKLLAKNVIVLQFIPTIAMFITEKLMVLNYDKALQKPILLSTKLSVLSLFIEYIKKTKQYEHVNNFLNIKSIPKIDNMLLNIQSFLEKKYCNNISIEIHKKKYLNNLSLIENEMLLEDIKIQKQKMQKLINIKK